MEPYLPKDVIYRPKSGFGAPLRQWLHGELREVVMEMLGERSLKDRGLFDPKAVRELIDELDNAAKVKCIKFNGIIVNSFINLHQSKLIYMFLMDWGISNFSPNMIRKRNFKAFSEPFDI